MIQIYHYRLNYDLTEVSQPYTTEKLPHLNSLGAKVAEIIIQNIYLLVVPITLPRLLASAVLRMLT